MPINPKLRSDLILLLAAAIWGFAFVAQRLGMEFLGPFTYTAVRFSLGTIVLIPFYYYSFSATRIPRHKESQNLASLRVSQAGSLLSGEKRSEKRKLLVLQLLLGVVLFFGISFQQYGLLYTTAGNAGFLTGLYVVLVPVAGLFLGHKSHLTIWIGVILALTGLYFLSVTRNFTINRGDIYVAICALIWTIHVLLVSYIAPRTNPIRTAIIQFAICSILSWIIAIGFEQFTLQSIINSVWPILYGGVMSVGIAYTLQIVAQQKAHPAYASIILSLESVFAVFGGWMILHEHFSTRSLIGCVLMLSGMVVVQIRESSGK